MKKYNIGDRFRSKVFPELTAELLHIVDLGPHTSYGVVVKSSVSSQEYHAVDSQYFHENWDPIPKFFEEKKTYIVKGEAWDTLFRIAEVVEYRTFGNGIRRIALALRQYKDTEVPKLLNEDDFDNMVEVED